MKHILKTLFIYVIWLSVIFGAISFYHISLDIRDWSEESRFIFSLLGILGGLCISGIYYLEPNKCV